MQETRLVTMSGGEVIRVGKCLPLKRVDVPHDKASYVTFVTGDHPNGVNVRTGLGRLRFVLAPSPVDDDHPYTLSSQLNAEDELLHAVASTLYYDSPRHPEGGRVMPLSTIWRSLGHAKAPSNKEREQLLAALWRLSGKIVTITNRRELESPGNKYKEAIIDKERLFNCKQTTVEVCGQRGDAIRVYDEPPLARFARSRGQVMAVPVPLLVAAGKGARAATITTTLLRYVSKARQSGKPTRVSWTLLYKATAVSDKDYPKIKTMAVKFLRAASGADLINNFRQDKTGITIICDKMI